MRLSRLFTAVRNAFGALFDRPPQERTNPAIEPDMPPLTTTTRVREMRIRDESWTDGTPLAPIRAFEVAQPMPGVLPEGAGLAFDAAMDTALSWAGRAVFDEGQEFLGYPYLVQLTQRPEYRRPSEILAGEMTRRWIRFVSTGEVDKTDKLKQIKAEFERLNVQDLFRQAAEKDGFFGRSHLFIDVGSKDPKELAFQLSASRRKIAQGTRISLKLIEPMWTYPDAYNSTDPLRDDFYKPTSWYVMGKRVHASRLLTFIGRDVPDMLKPAYSFGGLSLSQIAKPYVDNWLRTRQSVSDAVNAYSVMVLKTNMGSALTGGGLDNLKRRGRLFNRGRDNHGLFLIDKETEEFDNVSMPLSGLDHLQAQAQEHQSAVTGIPLIVLLGITPSGLNASSDGELQRFEAWTEAFQKTLFGPKLNKLLDVVQICLFGFIDPEIGYVFEPLRVLSEEQQATVRKAEAETDAALITAAIIDPHEARTRLASDPDSPYSGLNLSIVPTPPGGEGGPGEGEGEGEGDDDDPTDPGSGGGGAPTDKPDGEQKPTPGAIEPVKAAQDAAPAMRAAGIIFRDPDGRVLFIKRAGGAHAGTWGIPAGKIEQGEDAPAAARRESSEETGYYPTGSLLKVDETETPELHFTTFELSVKGAFKPLLNEEHTDWAWWLPVEPPTPLHPGVAATLKRLSGATLASDAGWIEDDHERAPNGQFGSGSGGASGAPKPTVAPQTAPVVAKASAAREFVPHALYEEAQRTIALYSKEESPTEPLSADEKSKATEQLAQHLAAAHAAKPAYDEKLKAIGDGLGAEVKLAGIKGGDRLLEKHVRENKSDPTEMKDLVRGSLVVKSLDDVGPALEAIGKNFKIARVKDRFAKPMATGYSDMLINVELPGGILGEVQIHVPEMLAAKGELGHALYDIERKLPEGSALKDQLVEMQSRVYGAASAAAKQKVSGPRRSD